METGKRRKHDAKFKERAVQAARTSGNVAATARELGLGNSLLHSWINAAKAAEAKGKGLALALEERQEMEQLRKRLAEAEEELEVTKKAMAYFAKERLKKNTPGLRR
ncbi:MAG TPA: transposase [Fibrobacteria bacterium]|nr:transposase [Fibrobacteria bacterium]